MKALSPSAQKFSSRSSPTARTVFCRLAPPNSRRSKTQAMFCWFFARRKELGTPGGFRSAAARWLTLESMAKTYRQIRGKIEIKRGRERDVKSVRNSSSKSGLCLLLLRSYSEEKSRTETRHSGGLPSIDCRTTGESGAVDSSVRLRLLLLRRPVRRLVLLPLAGRLTAVTQWS